MADVAGGAVAVTRNDSEIEQRQVEASAARSYQRPRATRRPETSVVGDGAGQVVWTVVAGVHLQLTDVLAWWKHWPRLHCKVKVNLYSALTLAVWLSGNALVSINVVIPRQAWLVPGWVTVFWRVNYLGM